MIKLLLRKLTFAALFTCLLPMAVTAQISLTGTAAQTQNFNSMTTTTLPAFWRMGAQGASSYTGGIATVTQSANSGMPTTGGTYRWGANGAYTDVAVGAMTSGSFASPNNLMVGYTNNYTGYRLTGYTITATAERYRRNTSGVTIKLQVSTNGTSWTDITGGTSSVVFAPGSSTYLFAVPEAMSMNTGAKTLTNPVNVGSSVYFNVSFNTGGSNSQGVAIDDWTFTPVFTPTATVTAPTVQASAINFTNVTQNSFTVNWTNGNGSARIVNIANGPSVSLPVDGTDPVPNSVYATSGQVVYNGSGTAVTVTNLAPNTRYYIWVFEYNGTGAGTKYNINAGGTPGNKGNELTLPGGCQSVTLNQAASICQGSTYNFRGRTLTAAGTYRDTVQFGGTCDSIRVLTLQVNPTPATPTIFPANSVAFCAGDSVNFTASGGAVGSTYLWSTGATTQQIFAKDTGTFTVRVITGGCTSLVSTSVHTVKLASPAAPSIATLGATVLCPGESVTLMASSADGYIWSNGAATQSITVSTAGNYSVKALSGGCTSPASGAISVVQAPGAQAQINAPTGLVLATPGDSLQLSTTTGYTYQWSNGATTASIWVKTPGTYIVTATLGTCTASDTVVVTLLTGVKANINNQVVKLYPNPVNDKLSVTASGKNSLQLYNAAGKLVQEAAITNNGQLNLVNLPAGIYTLRCTNANGFSVHKVVKQ